MTPAVAVDHDAGRVPAVCDRHLQRVHGQTRLHPLVDRVPDDSVRPDVFDRAAVQLPLSRPVLCYVREPQLVGSFSGEVAFDEIVMHGGACLLVAAFPGRDHRADARQAAQPPHAPLTDPVAEVVKVVCEDPVPALGIILMQPAEHLDQMRVLDITRADGACQPLVVRLLAEAEQPTRHRDRHPGGGTGRGHLTDERVDHFGGVICACDR